MCFFPSKRVKNSVGGQTCHALRLEASLHVPGVLDPELFVEGAGDQTPLEEGDRALMVAFGYLKVQVGLPVLQLLQLQRLDVEVGPLDPVLEKGPVTNYLFRQLIIQGITVLSFLWAKFKI